MRKVEIKETPLEDGAVEVCLPITLEQEGDLWEFYSVNEEESFPDGTQEKNDQGLRMKTPENHETKQRGHLIQLWQTLCIYWRNQRVACVWLILYAGANAFAFYYKSNMYLTDTKHEAAREVFGHCVVAARGAAMCLNLNACLIMLPLCRHFWTWIQRSPAVRCCSWFPSQYYDYYQRKKPKKLHWSSLFPVDQWVLVHKVIGLVFLCWTLLHCAAHACDFHRFAHHPYEEDLLLLFPNENTIPSDPAGRWRFILHQPAAITGVVMVLCILLAYPLILYREKFGYNIFWYSHHLLLVMIVTLLFHGMGHLLEPPRSYIWVGIPLVLYMIPRIWREMACYFCPEARAQVIELTIKPGNVVCLKMTKPNCWNNCLRAGMYANVNIPYISRVQWHPFTMSSSPSDKYIEFHIRPVGDWTTELFKLAESLAPSAASSSCDLEKSITDPNKRNVPKNKGKTQSWASIDQSESDLSATSTNSTLKPSVIGNCEEQSSNSGNAPPSRRQLLLSRGMDRHASSLWLWDAGSSLMNLRASATTRSGDTAISHSTMDTIPEQTKAPLSLRDLVVKVDGPLGAPAQAYSRHRMVVLVGAGIGITPMVSIVKELLTNPGKMQRTYLLWSFREHRAMDWFASLFQDVLKKSDANRSNQHSLQFRFFVTSKSKEEQNNEQDATITNSSSMTIQYGRRPDFGTELSRIHKDIRSLEYNKCGIFICGPTSMAKMAHRACDGIFKQDPEFRFYCHAERFSV